MDANGRKTDAKLFEFSRGTDANERKDAKIPTYRFCTSKGGKVRYMRNNGHRIGADPQVGNFASLRPFASLTTIITRNQTHRKRYTIRAQRTRQGGDRFAGCTGLAGKHWPDPVPANDLAELAAWRQRVSANGNSSYHAPDMTEKLLQDRGRHQMKQHKRTWQRHEQRVAGALGVQRVGNSGSATADVTTPWLAVECKSWRTLPAKVLAALRQAEAAAAEGQLPIAVLHAVGQRSAHDLVVMRWEQFVAWHGDIATPETPGSKWQQLPCTIGNSGRLVSHLH